MRLEKSEVQDLVSSNANILKELKESATILENRVRDFAANREIFNGQAARVVEAYLTEVHCTLLMAWSACIECLKIKIENYLAEITMVDDSDKFIIETDYVEEFAKKIKEIKEEFNLISDDSVLFVSKYQKYLNHDSPPVWDLLNDLQYGAEKAENLVESSFDLNSQFSNVDDITTILDSIEEACKCDTFLQIDPDTGKIKYFPGLINEYDWFANLTVTDAMIDMLYARFFNEDGTLNYDYINEILSKWPNEISDLEWAALIKLFLSDDITYNDIIRIFSDLESESPIPREQLKQNAAALAEKIMMIIILSQQAMVLEGITVTPEQEQQLMEWLRRAQLLGFIGTIDDWSQHAPEVDDDYFNNGIIRSGGKEYQMQTWDEFMTSDSTSDFLSKLVGFLIDQSRQTEWLQYVLGVIMTALGFIPGTSFLYPLAALMLALNKLNTYYKHIAGLIDWLTKDGKYTTEEAMAKLAKAIGLLGGYLSYVRGPNGCVITGISLFSPRALMTLAGLLKDLDISEEKAISILSDSGPPKHPMYDKVFNYINGKNGEGLSNYEASIRGAFHNSKELREKYDIDPNESIDSYPSSLMNELIKLVG